VSLQKKYQAARVRNLSRPLPVRRELAAQMQRMAPGLLELVKATKSPLMAIAVQKALAVVV